MSNLTRERALKIAYDRGLLSPEQTKAYEIAIDRGIIGQKEQPTPEQLPEPDTQDTTFMERNLPLVKEDLKGLAKQALPALYPVPRGGRIKKLIDNPDLLKQATLSVAQNLLTPVPSEKIGFGREIIKKQVPGLAKQIPGQVLKSLKDSSEALFDPSLQKVPEYERLKAGADIAGTLYGAGAGATIASKGIGAGFRGLKKVIGSKPGVISRTKFDSARDVLEKPNIKEVLSGSKRVPIGKFTDPRFISKVGTDTAERLDDLKGSIMAKQKAAVSDAALPPGLNKKILTSLKKEGVLNPRFKTVEKPLSDLEKKSREAMFDYSKTKKVREPITEKGTTEEILEATTAIKSGKATNKANLKNIIEEIQDSNLTSKKAYELRQQADQSINYADPKQLQKPYIKIRDILDDALRSPEFNPKWKEYGRETDNLSSLLENKKVKSLMKETDPDNTTFSFGEKIMSAKPGLQTGFREVVSKLNLDENQKGLRDMITEGLDTIEMSKAYKEVSAPFLKKLPFGVGEFGEEIYKRSIPIRQGAGVLGKSIKTFKGVGRANLLQRAADGSYTEESKKTLTGGNKP